MPHVVSSKKILAVAQAADPKQGILDAVGPINDKMQVLGDWVIAGTYIQPERRKSGLILAPDTLKEDEYQGVVGLVLQMGPNAEKLAEELGPGAPNIGDWVHYSIQDSRAMTVNGAACRRIKYGAIIAVLSGPEVLSNA